MNKTSLTTKDIAYISVFAAVLAICSWISIPTTVPFTLQTFGVFLTCMVIGGKRGTISILIFLLLGAIGIPVFSGFVGGIGVILGTTGGYMLGFVFTGLIMWFFEKVFPDKIWITAISMLLGLVVCYIFGTAWFMNVYANSTGTVGLVTVLGWCVFPFIIPDLVKIALALVLGSRLRKVVKL